MKLYSTLSRELEELPTEVRESLRCHGGRTMDEVLAIALARPQAYQEQPVGTTRLLVRERYAYTQRWAPLLVEPVAVVAFVMSQRMLRGIRDRAEWAGRPTA